MNMIQLKKATIALIDQMIENADKGPSGFWTDDHEGCGNPLIFPEFEEGLKRGNLIQKKHYLCPWQRTILKGGNGNDIHSGCYYSCSISDAKYLSAEMIAEILKRFKDNVISGVYDHAEKIFPLMTVEEEEYINARKKEEIEQKEKIAEEKRIKREQDAKKLLNKFADDESAQSLIKMYYGERTFANSSEYGFIDFHPDAQKEVVGAGKMTYDDFIEVQIKTIQQCRKCFADCFYNIPSEFKGRVERKSKGRICFERIVVEGLYSDGFSFFSGKEDHVWMAETGFEEYKKGDCISFGAEVYRYIKTGNGKAIDFGLRNPVNIKKLDHYAIPTDNELLWESAEEVACETCFLQEQCFGVCLLADGKRQRVEDIYVAAGGTFPIKEEQDE